MKKHIALTVGLATLLTFTGRAGQEQLAASIKETREEAAATGAQLSTTLNALNGLAAQKEGDLRPAFRDFQAEIPKTQAAAKATEARAEKMTREKERYFGDWQKTINEISNMKLHKKAQKRLTSASESYDEVRASMIKAGEKFRPFLSDLADVEKTLSQDVTAAGVKSVKSVVRRANYDSKAVSSAIDRAVEQMRKMEASLSSAAQ